MKGFKEIPPKQKYMALAEINAAYGPRGVVAYSCKVADSVPEGGFVIAVQDSAEPDGKILKAYQRQLMNKFPAKAPIYYMKVVAAEGNQQYTLYYDNGTGEKKAIPKIEIKKSEAEEAINLIPSEILAAAIIAAFKSEESGCENDDGSAIFSQGAGESPQA